MTFPIFLFIFHKQLIFPDSLHLCFFTSLIKPSFVRSPIFHIHKTSHYTVPHGPLSPAPDSPVLWQCIDSISGIPKLIPMFLILFLIIRSILITFKNSSYGDQLIRILLLTRQKFIRPFNSFFFGIIPKRPITHHFKKRKMAVIADIMECPVRTHFCTSAILYPFGVSVRVDAAQEAACLQYWKVEGSFRYEQSRKNIFMFPFIEKLKIVFVFRLTA